MLLLTPFIIRISHLSLNRVANTVFSDSLIHTADLISPLICQIEHIERDKEASEHLPQEEKYVVARPSDYRFWNKNQDTWTDKTESLWATTRQMLWNSALENEAYGHHIWREIGWPGREEGRAWIMSSHLFATRPLLEIKFNCTFKRQVGKNLSKLYMQLNVCLWRLSIKSKVQFLR